MKTIAKYGIMAVLAALTLVAQTSAQTSEDVTFTTSDGVIIAGTLWNAGAGKPAVICLHQWRSDRTSFAALAKLLASSGMTVLTIDARGYGGSTSSSSGSSVRPDRDIQHDVTAAMNYLQKTVKPSKTGLLGASYGSSNAVIYTAKNKGIAALVLLSPGLNYFKVLPTEDAVQKLGPTAVLAVASSEDLRSVEAVERYKELLNDRISTKIYADIGHGTDMLSGEKELAQLIKDFLFKSLR